MDSDKPCQQIQNTSITKETIVDRYAVWFKGINDGSDDDYDDDGNDDLGPEDVGNLVDGSVSAGSLCKMVIMQYETLTPGRDNQERLDLIETLKSSGNNVFDKVPTVYERLSLDHILCATGDVLHFIGHSTSLVDGASGVVIRESSRGNEYMKLSDANLSLYLGRVYSDRPMRLIFMSMCDKFPLACMLTSTIRSSGSFYVVCWHGKVPDGLAYAFSVAFYEACASHELDITKAFDVASINVLSRSSVEKPAGCFPLLLRQGEKDEDPASLLRANWMQRPELIDQGIQDQFKLLCSSNENLSDAIREGEHMQLPEGNRNWHVGNQIGNHEKAALRELGFNTVGHTLNPRGMVADVDAFWDAQNNLDKSLWSVQTGKSRRWPQLWRDVLPKVIKECRDMNKLQNCRSYLDKVIHLRQVEYNQQKQSINASIDPRAQSSLDRNHHYMLMIIGLSKKAVKQQISKLARQQR